MQVKYDGEFFISTGKNRLSTSWKQENTNWSGFLDRVSKTHKTVETVQEYLKEKKAVQDQIKDIGGFVGGVVVGGQRKANNILSRQLITLDIDFCNVDFWDSFQMMHDFAACMYSTHKHQPKSPRLRFIIPLDREVAVDEYEAISRKVADWFGISIFDPTTFQPSRLMYWPSTSKDGEYLFEWQDGPWLCADKVLSMYRDWRDISQWPMHPGLTKRVSDKMKEKGDPLEKGGLVGAFCRAFDIHTAIIDFLPDDYRAGDTEFRYSYIHGSTSNGMVIYDDKWGYSHHGTDPACGQLLNAYDLVRVHKFGLQDSDAIDRGVPYGKLPSNMSMREFARGVPQVIKLLNLESIQKAKYEFADEIMGAEVGEELEADGNWLDSLEVDKQGTTLSTAGNIKRILKLDPALRKKIVLDLFDQRCLAGGDLPWRKVTKYTKEFGNTDDSCLRNYLSERYKIRGKEVINDSLAEVVSNNTIHSVRDYLKSLEWDGVARVENILIDYLGASDTDYTKAVTRKSLIGAVARIFEPGIKFDTMPVIIGPQGAGKSTIISRLGGRWFSDSFSFKHLAHNPDKASEQVQGVWFVEIAELSGMRMALVEDVKNFLGRREDRYRVIFRPKTEPFPRQCVFWGTTNNDDFLKDLTGNRRFWPVKTMVHPSKNNVFTDFTQDVVDQVWAEAVELYGQGEALILSPEMEQIAAGVQKEFVEKDERIGLVQAFLDKRLPENWYDLAQYEKKDYFRNVDFTPENQPLQRDKICVAEIWNELFGLRPVDMNSHNTKDLHNMMARVEGWVKSKGALRFRDYGTQRAYVRVGKSGLDVNADGSMSVYSEK